MDRPLRAAIDALRRDIEEWQADFDREEAPEESPAAKTAAALRAWLAEGELIISDSGY